MQKNFGKNVKKGKHRKGFGNSIFKRKKGTFRKAFNTKKEIKSTHHESNQVDKEKSDSTEEDEPPSSKYSSGKVSGLEQCSKCGVGYRYFAYTSIIYLPFLF